MTKSVRSLLRDHDLSPKKKLGQNFLTDPVALERIVTAADLSGDDVVIEVGPGLGTLTRPLAERAGRVISIELDSALVDILQRQLGDLQNVQIIHGDILKVADPAFSEEEFKVVANLPYYITSAVLRRFLEHQPRPRLLVVTVQGEVAERIAAQPGKMSLLAVSVQFYGTPHIVTRIPAGAFYPVPKVDSAVLRIDVDTQPRVTLAAGLDETAFFRVVRAGFSQKRKTLRNSLSAGLHLSPAQAEEALIAANVDPHRRAQTIELFEWAEIAAAIAASSDGISG